MSIGSKLWLMVASLLLCVWSWTVWALSTVLLSLFYPWGVGKHLVFL